MYMKFFSLLAVMVVFLSFSLTTPTAYGSSSSLIRSYESPKRSLVHNLELGYNGFKGTYSFKDFTLYNSKNRQLFHYKSKNSIFTTKIAKDSSVYLVEEINNSNKIYITALFSSGKLKWRKLLPYKDALLYVTPDEKLFAKAYDLKSQNWHLINIDTKFGKSLWIKKYSGAELVSTSTGDIFDRDYRDRRDYVDILGTSVKGKILISHQIERGYDYQYPLTSLQGNYALVAQKGALSDYYIYLFDKDNRLLNSFNFKGDLRGMQFNDKGDFVIAYDWYSLKLRWFDANGKMVSNVSVPSTVSKSVDTTRAVKMDNGKNIYFLNEYSVPDTFSVYKVTKDGKLVAKTSIKGRQRLVNTFDPVQDRQDFTKGLIFQRVSGNSYIYTHYAYR